MFLVLSVCSRPMKLHCFVSVLSVFFVKKTKRFSGLHLVVLFFGCFMFNFLFFIP